MKRVRVLKARTKTLKLEPSLLDRIADEAERPERASTASEGEAGLRIPIDDLLRNDDE